MRLAIALLIAAFTVARADGLVDGLASDDPKAVAAAVAAIEAAPAGTPELADALLAAARACEDTLVDPARALALYERITREVPDARVAVAAGRRAETLRAQVGSSGEHAERARELAKLIDEANDLPAEQIVARAEALGAAAWPGAPDALLWLAEWLRRAERFEDAQARYRAVIARWPGSAAATRAMRGSAGAAIEARDWDLAEEVASQLPEIDPADRIVREDLLAAADRGRKRGRWYTLAWIAVLAGFAVLAGSLLEATLRGGWRRPKLRPPLEVLFLAPVAAVLVGVALTTHYLIAPAVAMLVIGGLVLAWLSGAAIETARDRGRSVQTRIGVHVIASLLTVTALFYVAITREELLDMVIETVKFGPE